MKTINLISLIVCGAALLSACQPDTSLPTAAALPTEVAVIPTSVTTPSEAPETALPDRALPATWTLTPSVTATSTLTLTPTVTITPSATITETATSTPSPAPTLNPEDRARTSLVLELEARLTNLPPGGFVASPVPMQTLFPAVTQPTPENGTPSIVVLNPGSIVIPTAGAQTPLCAYFPPGGFATVYNTNPDLASALGCAAGTPPNTESIQAATQPFQVGLMIWLNGTIYVFRAVDNTFTIYPDTFSAGIDPETSTEVPPSGFYAPMRGFLKVWSSNLSAKELGWAVQPELGAQATVQRFERGLMIAIPGRQDILVLLNASGSIQSGTWRSVIGQF